MKKIIFILILSSFNLLILAQSNIDNEKRGTITVQKKGLLHSIFYDDVNFRLIGKDVYGNIMDTAVIAFDIDVTIKGIAYSEKVIGSFLSKQMQIRMSRLDALTTLFFSNIKAKEKNGSIISFPNFSAKTGFSKDKFDE